MYKTVVLLPVAFFSVSCHTLADNNDLYIDRFSEGIIDNWEVKAFAGKTEYKIVTDSASSQNLELRATSNSTASGLFAEKRRVMTIPKLLQDAGISKAINDEILGRRLKI